MAEAVPARRGPQDPSAREGLLGLQDPLGQLARLDRKAPRLI